jgi:hypothetical protein
MKYVTVFILALLSARQASQKNGLGTICTMGYHTHTHCKTIFPLTAVVLGIVSAQDESVVSILPSPVRRFFC